MNNSEERLLNREEVERQYGIPKRFLEAKSKSHDGPPIVRLGRLVRYRHEDIRNWISANTQKGGC